MATFQLPDPKEMAKEAAREKKIRQEKERQERKEKLREPDKYLRELKEYFANAEAKPPRVPAAYGYARVSTNIQYTHGDSIAVQIERLENYYKFALEPQGIIWGGIEFDKQGVSAKTVDFLRRPAGKELLRKMHAGDHLIIDRIDRGWRNLGDFSKTMTFFADIDVKVHYLSMNIDTSTPQGRMIANILANFAQFESEQTGQRVSNRNEWALRNGFAYEHHAPYGFKRISYKDKTGKIVHIMAWNEKERKLMGEVVDMYENKKLSFSEIGLVIYDRIRRCPWARQSYDLLSERIFAAKHAQYMYCIERFLQDHDITEITDRPKGLNKLASQYCKAAGYLRENKSNDTRRKNKIRIQQLHEKMPPGQPGRP